MRRSTNTASCFKTRSTDIEMKVNREERLKIKLIERTMKIQVYF